MGASGELGREDFARWLLGTPTAAGQPGCWASVRLSPQQAGRVTSTGPLPWPGDGQGPGHFPRVPGATTRPAVLSSWYGPVTREQPLGSVRGAQTRAHNPYTSWISTDPALPAAYSLRTLRLWSFWAKICIFYSLLSEWRFRRPWRKSHRPAFFMTSGSLNVRKE